MLIKKTYPSFWSPKKPSLNSYFVGIMIQKYHTQSNPLKLFPPINYHIIIFFGTLIIISKEKRVHILIISSFIFLCYSLLFLPYKTITFLSIQQWGLLLSSASMELSFNVTRSHLWGKKREGGRVGEKGPFLVTEGFTFPFSTSPLSLSLGEQWVQAMTLLPPSSFVLRMVTASWALMMWRSSVGTGLVGVLNQKGLIFTGISRWILPCSRMSAWVGWSRGNRGICRGRTTARGCVPGLWTFPSGEMPSIGCGRRVLSSLLLSSSLLFLVALVELIE